MARQQGRPPRASSGVTSWAAKTYLKGRTPVLGGVEAAAVLVLLVAGKVPPPVSR